MNAEPDLARLASTVGDPRRIQMLALLMEGRALTAKELALGAGIEPATATSHLKRLQGDGLLASTSQGRHKYFRLASEQVAHLVESLMQVAPRRQPEAAAHADDAIRQARYCYDHLAGSLGTGLLSALLRKGWLTNDAADATAKQLEVTAKGAKSFAALGIDLKSAQARRRQFACRCLDWSERRDHLGGALGAALADHLLAEHWIERKKHSRVVHVTDLGKAQLGQLGLNLPA